MEQLNEKSRARSTGYATKDGPHTWEQKDAEMAKVLGMGLGFLELSESILHRVARSRLTIHVCCSQ